MHLSRLREDGLHLTIALVRVGDDPASEIYVRHKVRACERVGLRSQVHHLDSLTTTERLLDVVNALNDDGDVDGILVQLPLPSQIDEDEVLLTVDPSKDVDGFHPANLGKLMAGSGLLEPCTPSGVMTLLAAAGVEVRGKRAVVVGRSVIVGRPMAQMLLRADATVTVCHRHTTDLATLVREADILVVATGVPGLIKGDWVKEGSVVIDVGINRLEDQRLVGDVEFLEAKKRARAVTPVPGGVGPMTIATLMWNTLLAGSARRGALGEDIRNDLRRSRHIR